MTVQVREYKYVLTTEEKLTGESLSRAHTRMCTELETFDAQMPDMRRLGYRPDWN